jgi:shikimate dehydrogenase
MTPRGTRHRLGLVGSGIELSLAPAFHVMAGERLGLDVTYELVPQAPERVGELDAILRDLAGQGYQGLNVTVPFKGVAARMAAQPGAEVVAIGVANTLLLGPDGPTRSHNTDYSGFKWAYERRFGTTPPGTVAVLGAGGVGSATAAALVDLDAAALRIYDLVPERSRDLADRLRSQAPSPSGSRSRSRSGDGSSPVDVSVVASAEDAVAGADGIVNGTPVGMTWHPGTPVDLAAVAGQRWIFDAIYSPIETPLMTRAASEGLDRITGFDLFLGQAIDAFALFTGHQLPAAVLAELEARLWRLERERGV